MKFIYLLGVPGAGKTTLLRAVIEELGWMVNPQLRPFNHSLLIDRSGVQGAILGRDRGEFGGTDALSMAVQPTVTEWVKNHPYKLILGEGDRLSNDQFFKAVLSASYDLRLILVNVPEDVAAQRRKDRGSNQNESWVKGRATKVKKLTDSWNPVKLDNTLPLDLAARECIALMGVAND